jgi:molybdate transport system substrate-binding protein
MKIKYSLLVLAQLISIVFIASLAGCASQTASPSSASVASTPAKTSTQAPPVTSSAAQATAAPASPSASSPAASIAININVGAAASLTDALKSINTLYIKGKSNVTVTPNFASSGTLQTQIEQGAPADIFISAAATQMDNLQKENLILNETRQNLLLNKVVLIVPSDSTLGLTSFKDLATDKVKKVAIGDPKSVPAGTYAHQAFDGLGITAQVQPKEVLGSDVRQVLTYVESGNVDAGIVYSTDALTSTKVKVVGSAPDDVNAKVVYPAAVVKASKIPDAAKDYLNFLFGSQAKGVFEKYGFTVVSK